MSHVVEEFVLTAGDGGHFLHVFQHDGGHGLVIEVGGFAVLEENVGILGGAADVRMLGIHGVHAELGHFVPVDQGTDVLIVDDFDLLHFVRGAESVEEMAKRHAGIDGRQMGHQGQIHAFLHGGGGQEGETGLTAGHDVLVIAEDGKRVGGQSASRNMEDAGQQFAGYLVHVGDHQQQALGGGEGGGQGAGRQGAVHGSGRAGLGLHFTHGHGLAHEVFAARGGPVVRQFAHDGRGRDGEDGRRVGQSVGNMRGCGIAVHGFHFRHVILLAPLLRRCSYKVPPTQGGGHAQTLTNSLKITS